MPRALITSCGFFTAAGAGTNAATPSPGDTFAVPSFTNGKAYVENIWAEGATATFVRMTSPRMHDNNQGIRLQTAANLVNPLLPWNNNQVLYSSDIPVLSINASGAGSSSIAVTYSFDDLPGVNPRLAMWSDISARVKNISGVEVDLGAIGAIGSYSAGNAINSSFDNFKADTDYALLGYLTASSVLTLSVQGQDTGNQKIGGPGVADPKVTANFFANWSERTGEACIPVIAANNKGSTLVFQNDNTAHAAQNVSLIFAELG